MLKRVCASVLALALFAVLAACSAGPDARSGTLPSGIAYHIERNQNPPGVVQLRLVVRAGSWLEQEHEQGVAHLLEHLQFVATRRFKGTAIADFMEANGMAFGNELNAQTTLFGTTYFLNLPSEQKAALATGLQVLEDWCLGPEANSEELEREKGVVAEEWRQNWQNSQGRLESALFETMLAGTGLEQHHPLGNMDVLARMDVGQLEAFRDRWYCPENLSIIIVGDIDPGAMERDLRASFAPTFPQRGGQKAPPVPRERPEQPPVRVIDQRGTGSKLVNMFLAAMPLPGPPDAAAADAIAAEIEYHVGIAQDLVFRRQPDVSDYCKKRWQSPWHGNMVIAVRAEDSWSTEAFALALKHLYMENFAPVSLTVASTREEAMAALTATLKNRNASSVVPGTGDRLGAIQDRVLYNLPPDFLEDRAKTGRALAWLEARDPRAEALRPRPVPSLMALVRYGTVPEDLVQRLEALREVFLTMEIDPLPTSETTREYDDSHRFWSTKRTVSKIEMARPQAELPPDYHSLQALPLPRARTIPGIPWILQELPNGVRVYHRQGDEGYTLVPVYRPELILPGADVALAHLAFQKRSYFGLDNGIIAFYIDLWDKDYESKAVRGWQASLQAGWIDQEEDAAAWDVLAMYNGLGSFVDTLDEIVAADPVELVLRLERIALTRTPPWIVVQTTDPKSLQEDLASRVATLPPPVPIPAPLAGTPAPGFLRHVQLSPDGGAARLTLLWTRTIDNSLANHYRAELLQRVLRVRLRHALRNMAGAVYTVDTGIGLEPLPEQVCRTHVAFSCKPERVEELESMVRETLASLQGEGIPDAEYRTALAMMVREQGWREAKWREFPVVLCRALEHGYPVEDLARLDPVKDWLGLDDLEAFARE